MGIAVGSVITSRCIESFGDEAVLLPVAVQAKCSWVLIHASSGDVMRNSSSWYPFWWEHRCLIKDGTGWEGYYVFFVV